MLTLHDIHEGIERLEGELETLVNEIRRAGNQDAIAETQFKSHFAQERLKVRAGTTARITVDEVEDRATVQTQDERQIHLVARNNLTVLREVLRARQSQLDAMRTLAASFRQAGG